MISGVGTGGGGGGAWGPLPPPPNFIEGACPQNLAIIYKCECIQPYISMTLRILSINIHYASVFLVQWTSLLIGSDFCG